jgi:hypothetical protein
MSKTSLIPAERIERRILLVRGQKVLLDFQLAELYGVQTKILNQAVKRNIERFPEDFMFQLSDEESSRVMGSKIVTLDPGNEVKSLADKQILRSQIVTSKGDSGSGGRRYIPYAFTEQGVAMLSSVLHSSRAVQLNIAIMRTFVTLRRMLASNDELSCKLAALEQRYDTQFKAVFDAIRALMRETEPPQRGEIGCHTLMPASKAVAKALSKRR